MTLCIMSRQRSTTKHDWHTNLLTIHFSQIFFHHRHALHKQSAHSDRICTRGSPRIQDLRETLLDANIVHFIAIIRKNDVNKILADVVHITSDSRKHNCGFGFRIHSNALHMRLEKCDRFLHHRRALQHEWQLHTTCAKQFANRLHSSQEIIIDDCQWRIGLECFIK